MLISFAQVYKFLVKQCNFALPLLLNYIANIHKFDTVLINQQILHIMMWPVPEFG